MNHSESEFDAVADMQVRYEEALKAAENMPVMKFGLALERARARRSTRTPVAKVAAMTSSMTDAEIRGTLLKHFYELRNNNDGWVPTSDIILSPEQVSRRAIANVCQQLAEAGYIQWHPFNPPIEQHAIGKAKITGTGIDVVTGAHVPTIDVRFPNIGVRDASAAPASVPKELPQGLRKEALN